MKKINKKILIIISTIVLVLSLGIGVFAYFNMTKTQAITAESDVDTTKEQVFEIASFADLFRYSKASAYNDQNIVSTANTRKILKLTANIDLPVDLEITADVHINLNNNTLNLNDHLLTFRHGYAGCFNIFGGTISNGTNGDGKIIIDLPKASIVTDFTGDDCVDISNIDAKYTAYMALVFVANGIGSDLDKKVKIENYDTVSESTFDITQDELFIYEKDSCKFNSDSSDICSFVYKDLDLPFHYLSSDIDITYTSSNENVLTNEGIFTAPDTTADLTLTATINHDSWDNPYSCTFKLHAVNLNDSTVKNNVAEQLIKSYLNDYYINGTLVVNEDITISNYYGFNQGAELPLSALGGNITYSYAMTDYTNNAVTTTSRANNNVYVLEPNENCYHLLITLNGTSNVLNLAMYSTYVGDYETIARLILNKLYGGSIVFDATKDAVDLCKYEDLYDSLEEYPLVQAFIEQYNITGLTYSVKIGSEAEDYYDFDDTTYKLSLTNATNTPVKSKYVTATFTFGSGANAVDVDVDLYVDYLATSGDTLAGFLPYYNLYDPMVYDELTSSFEMPFSFGTNVPYICYDFATTFEKLEGTETVQGQSQTFNYYNYTLSKSSGLKVILYYNGANRLTFTTYGNSPTSFTNQLDAHLTSVGKTLKDIAEYGDAKYIFMIDAQNATVDNIKTLLIYNYKFNTTGSWNRYEYAVNNNVYVTELTSSLFTVCGGLFYNSSSTATNAVQDINFFKWIYNNFNPDEAAADLTTVNSDSFIPKNWLSLDVALDVDADSTLDSVSNFYGVGNLKSVTKVNLSGKPIDATILASIATMESVTSLKLVNCGITNISNICNMNTVKVLDVSNNSIDDFNGLVNMKNLEEVYVYSNKATTNNPIVGSLGITNFQTYNDLIKNGITVFNQVSSGVPVIYTDSDDYNDYAKLKSIIYQNKLSKAESITKLYEKYSGFTYTSFSLYNTGGTLNWGYQGDDDEGTKYVEESVTVGASVTASTYYEYSNGAYTLTTDPTFKANKTYYVVANANNATYFYVTYSIGNNVLKVKFYVDRY